MPYVQYVETVQWMTFKLLHIVSDHFNTDYCHHCFASVTSQKTDLLSLLPTHSFRIQDIWLIANNMA